MRAVHLQGNGVHNVQTVNRAMLNCAGCVGLQTMTRYDGQIIVHDVAIHKLSVMHLGDFSKQTSAGVQQMCDHYLIASSMLVSSFLLLCQRQI